VRVFEGLLLGLAFLFSPGVHERLHDAITRILIGGEGGH
jgi:hypothetical protein